MVKLAFKVISVFWITSPIVFLVMRTVGVFNYEYDWLIFIGFAVASSLAMFLTYKTWEN